MPFNTSPPYSLVQVINQLAVRALDTDYVNTTGRTMFVDVYVVAQVSALNDTAIAYVRIDSVNSSSVGHEAPQAVFARSRFYIGFKVMPGSTYAIKTSQLGTGFIILSSWVESH